MLKKETMKKQFLRVKQLANQNFGRAEKTEVLSDELLQCEKKVETLKHASHNTTKKLGACLQSPGYEYDKRLIDSSACVAKLMNEVKQRKSKISVSHQGKKLPESTLASTMMESSTTLGTNSVLGAMLATCGECQQNLAKELAQYEIDVESKVLQPLNTLAEVDIPNVVTLKKRLSKAVLDMDSARSRHQSAVRATTAGRGNLQEQVAKIDQLKEDLEDSCNKMESTRDAYVTEMLVLLAREGEIAEKFIEFVEAQAEYHKRAADSLDLLLPAMKALLGENPQQPVFGTSLEDHLRVSEREIAFPLEACCEAILHMGTDEEGLFRIAGSSSKVKKLKASFDLGVPDMADFVDQGQVHAITGVLKQYLRELPEPLLTFALYDEFVSANSIQDTDARLQALWTTVNKLPKPNFDNLRFLIKFLHKLAEYSDVTKMTSSNLALVIAPNIMWAKEDTISMMSTGTATTIVDSLIHHAAWFFPGEIDFGQNMPAVQNRLNANESQQETVQPGQVTTVQHVKKTPSQENLQLTDRSPDKQESIRLSLSPDIDINRRKSKKKQAPPVPANRPTAPNRPPPPAAKQDGPCHPKDAPPPPPVIKLDDAQQNEDVEDVDKTHKRTGSAPIAIPEDTTLPMSPKPEAEDPALRAKSLPSRAKPTSAPPPPPAPAKTERKNSDTDDTAF